MSLTNTYRVIGWSRAGVADKAVKRVGLGGSVSNRLIWEGVNCKLKL